MKRPALAIIILALTAAAVFAEPVTLRYKTSPGDLYYFADKSETTGTMRFISQQQKILNSVSFNRKSKSSTRMDTVSVDNGAATIHIYVDKYRLTDNGLVTVDYDSEKREEEQVGDLDFLEPYAMTIDERGGVLGFEKLEKDAGQQDKFDWKKMSTVMQVSFPTDPVDIGEEWVSMVSMVGEPSPYDIKNVTRQFKLMGFEKVKGLDCAKIRFRVKIENAPGLAQDLIATLPPDAGPKVEGTTFDVRSDVYFAHAEGVLVAIEAAIVLMVDLSITAPVDGRNERVKVKSFFKTESVYELE